MKPGTKIKFADKQWTVKRKPKDVPSAFKGEDWFLVERKETMRLWQWAHRTRVEEVR